MTTKQKGTQSNKWEHSQLKRGGGNQPKKRKKKEINFEQFANKPCMKYVPNADVEN